MKYKQDATTDGPIGGGDIDCDVLLWKLNIVKNSQILRRRTNTRESIALWLLFVVNAFLRVYYGFKTQSIMA
ncbi:MAG TPA: hypothetical protein DET40_03580 [Lentisphaeria bacterium]|nr:MAG: hypothetical protein A2X45_23420 [Lentisphaerae bacterium GWF2_50_93]HCE42610.1 hypothetical protein [Lentisphaeria bacterium]